MISYGVCVYVSTDDGLGVFIFSRENQQCH